MAQIKVRARAVDMLGRQQIAGIPTAIHELLKNAHDAYAESVEIDFYRADGMLIIRDDGIGMTREDFESRWLTLGTESKVGANAPGAPVWTGPRNAAPRPIMGEKGIGRLAIAAIGPQVLVLTRAIRQDGLSPLVASLVNWRLFEIPGVDLASIHIPVVEMPDGELPGTKVLQQLAADIRKNVDELGAALPAEQAELVKADLDLMDFEPERLQALFSEPHLGGENYGTHFYIRPVADILADDIDARTDDSASPLQKMLLGFSNTMMPSRDPQVTRTRFQDHRADGRAIELIGSDVFFTPEEFESADHHIEGTFDAFGQFSGSVSIYQQPAAEHVIQWAGSTGKSTECGPFRIKFAYVQGRASESRLPTDDWAEISQKLNRIGGLYVYRDGIRILPYGNSDFDFLNIERRRTKSAQDWFFSYRRIFGAVEISHVTNSNLVEKAGREGFRANRAYREFAAILENFFERLAIDFFRPTSTYGEDYNLLKQSLMREAELLAKRERQVRERRRQFSEQLSQFFGAIEQGKPAAEAAALREAFEARVEALGHAEDADSGVQGLLQIENDGRTDAARLRERYTIARPRAFGMTKPQQRDWAAYIRNFERLEEDVFLPLEAAIDAIISEAATGALVTVDRRRRLVAGLEMKKRSATNASARLRREVGTQVSELSASVESALSESIIALSADIERTFADIGRTDTTEVDEGALKDLQAQLEGRIDESAAQTRERLESLRDQLVAVAEAVSSELSVTETTAALESRSEGLREQLDAYAELAQVGMALGIVQHEFASTANAINEAISRLQPWGRANPDLAGLVRDVRGGFDHLENYLRLFAPMSRRLHRDRVEMTGEQIRLYVEEVFGDRIRRHGIELRHTRAFDVARIRGFASTFLPAFVNIIDNALFWVTFDRDAEKWVELDADGEAFLITNGGLGIERRDEERIFEFGQSNKPGGRGMGLFISRQALNREGWNLSLATIGRDTHPTFRIEPARKADEVEDENEAEDGE